MVILTTGCRFWVHLSHLCVYVRAHVCSLMCICVCVWVCSCVCFLVSGHRYWMLKYRMAYIFISIVAYQTFWWLLTEILQFNSIGLIPEHVQCHCYLDKIVTDWVAAWFGWSNTVNEEQPGLGCHITFNSSSCNAIRQVQLQRSIDSQVATLSALPVSRASVFLKVVTKHLKTSSYRNQFIVKPLGPFLNHNTFISISENISFFHNGSL